MRSHQAGQFPLDTIVQDIGVVSSTISGVQRGKRYRLVSTQDCWISYYSDAVQQQGLFLPAKTPDYFAFGMDDKEGINIKVNVIAAFAGKLYITELRTVPTEG